MPERADLMRAIDVDVLTQLAADLPAADLRLVLQTFETDMQRLAAALAAAGQASDAAAWRRLAHSMAGAASAVGATEIEQQAREAMARASIDPATAARDIAAIDAAIDAALADLRDFTGSGSSNG
jgi:hypothetical protein